MENSCIVIDFATMEIGHYDGVRFIDSSYIQEPLSKAIERIPKGPLATPLFSRLLARFEKD